MEAWGGLGSRGIDEAKTQYLRAEGEESQESIRRTLGPLLHVARGGIVGESSATVRLMSPSLFSQDMLWARFTIGLD